MLLAGVAAFVAILILLPSEKASASRQSNDNALEIGKRYELAIEVEKLEQAANKANENKFLAELNTQFVHYEVKKRR
jgi:uncharacterized protein (DUF58 family)